MNKIEYKDWYRQTRLDVREYIYSQPWPQGIARIDVPVMLPMGTNESWSMPCITVVVVKSSRV